MTTATQLSMKAHELYTTIRTLHLKFTEETGQPPTVLVCNPCTWDELRIHLNQWADYAYGSPPQFMGMEIALLMHDYSKTTRIKMA